MEGLVGRNGAQAIQGLLASARDPYTGLAATLVASVLLLVGATTVLVELKGSLDELCAILSSAIAFGVIACLFAVIYKVLPDAPLSWRDVWVGAAFTAGLFGLGKYAMGLPEGRRRL